MERQNERERKKKKKEEQQVIFRLTGILNTLYLEYRTCGEIRPSAKTKKRTDSSRKEEEKGRAS